MKLVITDIVNFKLPISGEHKIIKPDKDAHHCMGCFGCWTKTPGRCVIKDEYSQIPSDISKCKELIIISECLYGGFSTFVKKIQDRWIPYVRPDFKILNGEMRHRRRCFNDFKLSVYFYGKDTTEEEKHTALEIVRANAKNFYASIGSVLFFGSPAELEGITL